MLMVDPAAGPFLFDTSAEGWLARNAGPDVVRWLHAYLGFHQILSDHPKTGQP